ncbi:uncharacterized protein LOC110660361 [Hevea brasiliensis]|uniref:uncharacterized protein LOC110660361 n=1 Tax=Hevea brasiliensis TaxID=3981 RepID=UPI0025F184B8|nr:uncharacterized protein LOC110660361 [Hevea brasiliensis]
MNPKEHYKAITLTSGRTLQEQKPEAKQKQKGETSENFDSQEEEEEKFQKAKLDKQFRKFLKVLQKLYINIPFVEALSQMPSYEKFLKEILSKKRRLEDYETVALTEESSVSLIPLSICQKLNIGELRSTTISLQLADRSVKYSVGILENIPIKVSKFFIPIDFVVLKMEEDAQIPIILGRPFLVTAGKIIDVKKWVVNSQNNLIEEEFRKRYPEDPLEACIMHSHTVEDENKEIAAYAQSFEANPPLPL